MSEGSEMITTANKIKQLEDLASGAEVTTSVDSSSLKSRMAAFMLAHADKVMDTVAPLEGLRDVLVEELIERAQARLDDPELTTGQIGAMIEQIQNINSYSVSVLQNILNADKLQAFINIDASDKSVNKQVSVMNLDNAQSRARVAKAVAAISKIIQDENSTDDTVIEGEVIEEEGK